MQISLRNNVYTFFRYFVLLFVPLALAILEIWHDSDFVDAVYMNLSPHINWWIFLHVLQIPLFALAGTGVWLLIKPYTSLEALIAKISLWIFIVFYAAFDSLAGIGTGLIVKYGLSYPSSQQDVIAQLAQNFFHDPDFGGFYSWFSLFASYSWLIAMIATVITLYRVHKPLLPLAFYLLSAYFLGLGSHAYPEGPLAFISLFLGNFFLEFYPLRRINRA